MDRLSDDEVLALTAVTLHLVNDICGRKRKRMWTRSWLASRKDNSVYYRLLRELKLEDSDTMRHWIRLNKEQYNELLRLVAPLIMKEDTNMRDAVTAGERLTLTLRYLATGERQASLACQFHISRSLISAIIPEVCRAIYQVLKNDYLKLPSNADEWHQVASQYYSQWNFPMCIGALDGKHVLISKPQNSASEYYDYKGQFSLMMMALVDASYKFLYVDIGTCGKTSDGGVWDRCSLKEAVESNMLNIPEADNLPFSNRKCPYVIVGDDAFPLKSYLMKPYPGYDQTEERQIFNYRLSRARRTSENAFGILAARFQVFKHAINTSPANAKDITFATVVLHNFLSATSKETYSPPEFLDREDERNGVLQQGQWHHHPHGGLERLQAVSRGHSNNVKDIRDCFKDYFNNEGKVPFQDRMVLLHSF